MRVLRKVVTSVLVLAMLGGVTVRAEVGSIGVTKSVGINAECTPCETKANKEKIREAINGVLGKKGYVYSVKAEMRGEISGYQLYKTETKGSQVSVGAEKLPDGEVRYRYKVGDIGALDEEKGYKLEGVLEKDYGYTFTYVDSKERTLNKWYKKGDSWYREMKVQNKKGGKWVSGFTVSGLEVEKLRELTYGVSVGVEVLTLEQLELIVDKSDKVVAVRDGVYECSLEGEYGRYIVELKEGVVKSVEVVGLDRLMSHSLELVTLLGPLPDDRGYTYNEKDLKIVQDKLEVYMQGLSEREKGDLMGAIFGLLSGEIRQLELIGGKVRQKVEGESGYIRVDGSDLRMRVDYKVGGKRLEKNSKAALVKGYKKNMSKRKNK